MDNWVPVEKCYPGRGVATCGPLFGPLWTDSVGGVGFREHFQGAAHQVGDEGDATRGALLPFGVRSAGGSQGAAHDVGRQLWHWPPGSEHIQFG